jgi:hypothetical protein
MIRLRLSLLLLISLHSIRLHHTDLFIQLFIDLLQVFYLLNQVRISLVLLTYTQIKVFIRTFKLFNLTE